MGPFIPPCLYFLDPKSVQNAVSHASGIVAAMNRRV